MTREQCFIGYSNNVHVDDSTPGGWDGDRMMITPWHDDPVSGSLGVVVILGDLDTWESR